MKQTLMLLAALLATSSLRPSLAAPEGSPESVVQKALDALNHNRLADFVQTMDPDALKEFRSTTLNILDLAVQDEREEEVLALFQGVDDPDSLKKLDAPAMFTAMITKATSAPEARMVMESMRVDVVGKLPDGKDGTYVVHRTKASLGNLEIEQLSATLLRKCGDDWKMTLDEFLGQLNILKHNLSDAPQTPDFDAAKFEPLGHVMDGKDAAIVVYRMDSPVGDSVLTKLGAVKATPQDAQWEAVLKDEKAPVQELLKKKVPLPRTRAAK